MLQKQTIDRNLKMKNVMSQALLAILRLEQYMEGIFKRKVPYENNEI